MEKSEEGRVRYKWLSSATNVLISIWSHEQVQKQLQVSPRNQPIWESIARYMNKRGFNVTGLQCRTRIKNMLCSYHEAVRKKDPSIIEPHFGTFEKVELKKLETKQATCKLSKTLKQEVESDDSNDEDISYEQESPQPVQKEYKVEYLDTNNLDNCPSPPDIGHLEKVITKAIETQTQAITNAITVQTEMIEKLLTAENERLQTIMAAERENRRQLETRLDRLINRLDATTVPQLTYMGAMISRHNGDG